MCRFCFLFFSGEKDKEKKHKKKVSSASANIATLLSSPSSSAKNSLVKNAVATTPSNTTSSPSVNTQGTTSVMANHSSPVKQLNSSQLSNQGAVKTEPGASPKVNSSNGAVTTENTSGMLADTSLNTTLQNGIQSGDTSLSEASEPSLPQCLPADVESCILRLKQAGADGVTEGKCKFFNSDVNHMLLE